MQFEDKVDVASSARKAKVYCSSEGGTDNHCTTINVNSVYNGGTSINLFQLSATSAQQVLFLKGFSTRIPAN